MNIREYKSLHPELTVLESYDEGEVNWDNGVYLVLRIRRPEMIEEHWVSIRTNAFLTHFCHEKFPINT